MKIEEVKNSPSDKPTDWVLIENIEKVFTINNYNPLVQDILKMSYDRKTYPKHHNKAIKHTRKYKKNKKK